MKILFIPIDDMSKLNAIVIVSAILMVEAITLDEKMSHNQSSMAKKIIITTSWNEMKCRENALCYRYVILVILRLNDTIHDVQVE